jgi:hypothetical protein
VLDEMAKDAEGCEVPTASGASAFSFNDAREMGLQRKPVDEVKDDEDKNDSLEETRVSTSSARGASSCARTLRSV